MRLVIGKLIKRVSDDGFFEIEDHIPIGKEYLVDIDSIRKGKGFNIPKKMVWEKEIIDVVDESKMAWMPTEMLEIENIGTW